MPRPIVIAYHLVWTAYGWWLPNDPRGSMSRTIRNDVIAELGELHHGRKRLQPASRDIRAFYEKAEDLLQFPLLTFGVEETRVIAGAFEETVATQGYTCYACAIMPDHIHVRIRKHRDKAEEMIEHFQWTSRLRLSENGLRSADHPVWGGSGWKVFLDRPEEVSRTIRYVEKNPRGMRLPDQHWSFVAPYDGWPLYPGHDPNSPYARALRVVGRYPR